ncbi:Gfo/Idh/MocA family protein [Singulisphaera acidiphila]|uniref:Putative dehydrogenase n=1 Tax=Singulisphaera acidiphila (strain ATCC BAA-1392 / DSM 18658 / VKM B-2454 / MOB10) TaxID=886293 RepID=L0DGW8_SINAD|nr:Gfo/Idh/MocA family oxidoreductase [Singulisphaera acidiphila]AGA27896.1 putative dehydrogenase [Singulisphaera acidiphila DSM 18658]
MSHLSRRQFLGRSVAAGIGASFAIGGTKSSGRVIGANDTIRIGVAGLNSRGEAHVDAFSSIKGVEITYLIDPDNTTFKKHLDKLKKRGGSVPKTVADVRHALDDKELDAISIATPNHWHALMTIWGCEAGKDVYVEKPASHNVHEGRIAVEAARKFGRIVQHGTQNRSNPAWAQVAAAVKSGKYGKLNVSRALCYKSRKSIGFKSDMATPQNIDFNLWTGPAPEHPFNENLVHYNWHWFWDYGNGDIGNQGVHEMDKARWLIPGATLPQSVISVGGRLGYKDQGQTANTQIAVLDYGDTQIIFEVRGLPTNGYHGEMVGNFAHLDAGTITVQKEIKEKGKVIQQGGPVFIPKGSDKGEPLPKFETSLGPVTDGEKGHFANFIAAVRSRKVDDLNADILEGHYSAALCHLANISYRLGKPTPFNSQAKAFSDNKDATEAFGRMEEHLKDNGVKLSETTYQVGPKLVVDAKTESFVDSPDGDKLLTREYRKPFVVPESFS